MSKQFAVVMAQAQDGEPQEMAVEAIEAGTNYYPENLFSTRAAAEEAAARWSAGGAFQPEAA